jgi:RNA polymerase sigma-70 factor, ECF subfamily
MNDLRNGPPRLDAEARSYARSIAMRFVKDDVSAADDIAQDAMLLAHRHLASFRGDARFSTWLYRVTTTAALMHLRRQRRRSREVLATADAPTAWIETIASRAPSAESVIAAREHCRQMRTAIDRLGPRYHAVFEMRFGLGHSETEVAKQTGLSLATVKARAHRAKIAAKRACPDRAATVSPEPRAVATKADR